MTTTIPHRITPESLGSQINLPNLLNGLAKDITSVAPKGSIPPTHHWCGLLDKEPQLAMINMDLIIRCQYSLLENVAKDREVAIVLGAARAAIIAMWRVTKDMLIPEEEAAPIIAWNVDRFIWATQTGGGNARVDRAHAMAQLTALEIRVCQAVIYMAAACIPLQGLSLVETDHHYIPTTAKFFAPVKKQVLATQSADVRSWIEGMGADFDDALWHKAAHPVIPGIKISIASDPLTKGKLVSARLGSAAVRLPALPSETKAGHAALALMTKCSSVILESGGKIDVVRLAKALELVATSRTEVERIRLIDQLSMILRDMSPNIAYCLGILEREAESAAMSRNSLFTAYSLQKIKSEYSSDYALGRTLYSGLASRRSRLMEEGILPIRDIK